MDFLNGLLGGGGGAGKSYGNSSATSSINFERGRESSSPSDEWIPVALAAVGGLVLLVFLWVITKK